MKTELRLGTVEVVEGEVQDMKVDEVPVGVLDFWQAYQLSS